MVQPDPIVCLDALTDTTYMPGEEWTQTRFFRKGPTAGMEGQFRLVTYITQKTGLYYAGFVYHQRGYPSFFFLAVNARTTALYPVVLW